VEDLKKDTAQFTYLLYSLEYSDSVSDKIFNCYDTVANNFRSTDCLGEIIPTLVGFPDFIYTDRTIQQLKNAGGLRLIRDKSVADSIIAYDAQIRRAFIHQDAMEVYQQKSIDNCKAMLDFNSFRKLVAYGRRDHIYNGIDIQLLQTDKKSIDNLFNTLLVFKDNLHGQVIWMKRLRNNATSLIRFLSGK
jgi:hypothetical protein